MNFKLKYLFWHYEHCLFLFYVISNATVSIIIPEIKILRKLELFVPMKNSRGFRHKIGDFDKTTSGSSSYEGLL